MPDLVDTAELFDTAGVLVMERLNVSVNSRDGVLLFVVVAFTDADDVRVAVCLSDSVKCRVKVGVASRVRVMVRVFMFADGEKVCFFVIVSESDLEWANVPVIVSDFSCDPMSVSVREFLSESVNVISGLREIVTEPESVSVFRVLLPSRVFERL